MSMWTICLRNMDIYIEDVPNPTTNMLIIFKSPITDIISRENIDIPYFIDINSQFDLDILITHHKGKQRYTLHPLHNPLPCAHLSTNSYAFVSSTDFHHIPKFV